MIIVVNLYSEKDNRDKLSVQIFTNHKVSNTSNNFTLE